jgi:hypothetical protein
MAMHGSRCASLKAYLYCRTYDTYQAINCFDALKNAWMARKREIETRAQALGGQGLFSGYGNYGPSQQYQQLEQVC